MATTIYNSTMAGARPGLLSRILSGAGHFILSMAEAGPRMAEVRRLNATSDADLAARGTTRLAEVHRIFGPRIHL